mmetsp:Transcript_25665/g.84505  ORF Transcript_25665/g.84505 Transcript_25665/m.84505 type:complete len:142 (-) Transcript_25665:280-705(-)
MLRAVVKAGDAITAAVPPAGAAMGEGRREWETRLLPGIRALGEACPTSFDETSLLEGDGEGLRREMLQARFEHLGRIMRCVGCDRCKLWGTLQARGFATAVRVLLADADGPAPALTRQEAVALVVTLERLSASLAFVRELL